MHGLYDSRREAVRGSENANLVWVSDGDADDRVVGPTAPARDGAASASLRVYASGSRGLCWVSSLRAAQPLPSNSCHPRVFTQRGLGTEATNCSPRAQVGMSVVRVVACVVPGVV